MTRTLRLTLLAAASATAFALTAGAASAQSYDRVVVFGDSLQDNGNLFRATNRTQPPSPPYFQGRFSNGVTFIEVLFPNQNPFGTATGNVNNAFGGARSDIQANPPSLPIQLQGYNAAGGRFGPRDLVSILGGANNLLQGIPGAAGNPNTAQAVIGNIANLAAADIGNLTRTIAAQGAGTILVGNLPNLGTTPQLAGPAAPLGTFATDTFNSALRAQLTAAAGVSPNTNIILADYNRASEFVRQNALPFGFTNTTQTCLNSTTGAVCANPDQFFFFDGVHPTAAAHRLLAAVAADYLYYGNLAAPTATQAETALEHRRRAMDAAMSGPAMLGERESRVMLTVEGGHSESDQRGAIPTAEIDTGLIRASVEAGLTGDLTGGVAISYTQSDTNAGPLTFETIGISGDAYAEYRMGQWVFNGMIGGGFEEYEDIRRVTSLTPAVHESDTTGWSFSAGLRAGYRIPVGGDATLTPRVGLDFSAVQVDAYDEDGPIARHSLDDRRVDALGAQATLRYDNVISDSLNLYVEGGYRDYFSYDGDPVSVGLVDNPADRLLTDAAEPDDGVAVLDAGISGQIYDRWTLSASYRGRFGDGYESNTGRIALGMDF